MAPAAEVENNRGGESLSRKVVSSNVHTMILMFLWDIQGCCPVGEGVWRRSGRHIKLEPIRTEQAVVSMWDNEMAWRATRREERTLERKGKHGPRGRLALRGEVEKQEPTR